MGAKKDKRKDSFMVFQKEVHAYLLANYKHPSDISYLVKKFNCPLLCLMKQMPTIDKLKMSWAYIHRVME